MWRVSAEVSQLCHWKYRRHNWKTYREEEMRAIFADLKETVKSIYGKWFVTPASVC
jgi:hypothetical protein